MLTAALGSATLAAQPAVGQQSSFQASDTAFPCDIGPTKVKDTMGAGNWAPVNPAKWQFSDAQISMTEPGDPPTGPRRPFEYAVLTKGPEFGSVQIDAQVRLDTPVEISNRDVIIVFGYQSPTKFYYAHFSSDNASFPHNGIFLVDDADRVRLDDQWNGTTGAPPAISDAEFHHVRVRHCAETGKIAVYVDHATTPLMTATDKSLSSGRVGFGSFDNIGSMRNMAVEGTATTPKK